MELEGFIHFSLQTDNTMTAMMAYFRVVVILQAKEALSCCVILYVLETKKRRVQDNDVFKT